MPDTPTQCGSCGGLNGQHTEEPPMPDDTEPTGPVSNASYISDAGGSMGPTSAVTSMPKDVSRGVS